MLQRVDPLELFEDLDALNRWIEAVGAEQATEEMRSAAKRYRATHTAAEVEEMGQRIDWVIARIEEFEP